MRVPVYREGSGVGHVAGSFAVGVFLSSVAGGLTFPILPRLEFVLGFSPAVVGLILSMAGGVRLVSNAPVGSVVDRVGTRGPILAGLVLLAAAKFGYVVGLDPAPLPLTPRVVFLASQATAGIGSSLVLVGGYAMLTDLTTPENRGRWLGYMLGSYGLGFPIGLAVGGIIADGHGVQAVFMLGGAVSFTAVPVIVALVPDTTPDVERKGGLRQLPGLFSADRRIALVGTVNGIQRFLSRAFITTIVVLVARRGLEAGGLGDLGVTGLILAVVTLAAAGSTLVAGRYSDRFEDRLVLVLPALCVMAFGFVVVAMMTTLDGIVAGGVVAATGGGATGPVLKAYLGDISPAGDVAKLGGAYDALGDLGGILGSLVALPTAASLGFDAVFLGCAGLGVIAVVLVDRTRHAAAPRREPSPTD